MTKGKKLDLLLSEIGGMRSEMQEMKNEMLGMRSEMQEMKDEMLGMKGGMQDVKKEMQDVKKEMQDVKKEMQDVKGEVQEAGNEMQGMEGGLRELGNKMQGMEGGMQEMKKRLRDAGQEAARLGRGLADEASQNIQLLAKSQMALMDKLGQAGCAQDNSILYELQISGLKARMERLEQELAEIKSKIG